MYMTTTEAGSARRLARLFGQDGRTLIIGYDHAVSVGTAGGVLAAIPSLARQSLRGGADALQMGLNSARLLESDRSGPRLPGLALRIDQSSVTDDPHQVVDPPTRWATGSQALRAGGDAVVIFYVHDTRHPELSHAHARMVGTTAHECAELGMPLMVEVMVKSDSDPGVTALSQTMIDAARIAFELGAGIVKIDRTPSPEAMPELTSAVPIPVLLRGGEPRESIADSLSDLERCLDAGVTGAVYGRTVWQSGDPEGVTRRLGAVIHGKIRENG